MIAVVMLVVAVVVAVVLVAVETDWTVLILPLVEGFVLTVVQLQL